MPSGFWLCLANRNLDEIRRRRRIRFRYVLSRLLLCRISFVWLYPSAQSYIPLSKTLSFEILITAPFLPPFGLRDNNSSVTSPLPPSPGSVLLSFVISPLCFHFCKYVTKQDPMRPSQNRPPPMSSICLLFVEKL